MSISTTKMKICVMGLGHIGLPIACILANSGYSVLGVDHDAEVVQRIQSTSLVTSEPNLIDLLKTAIASKNLTVSKYISSSEIYIIAVPTLLTIDNQPDLTCVFEAVDIVIPYLKPDNMVLITSTCPIGTTERIAQKLWMSCSEIFVAYCPERALPSNIIHEIVYNDRIIGGVNELSSTKALDFYKSFIKGELQVTSAKTAEAVKLAENAYRDLNIAYANELSMIADDVGLDTNELIKLANQHPRVQILNPGVGVGGYCLAIDPWFLASSASYSDTIISKAREINNKKTEWVIEKIREEIKNANATLIACLGLTYKANVSSIGNSNALEVVNILKKEINVLSVDPYVNDTIPLHEALINSQIIVILVAHTEFLNISKHSLKDKVVLDFVGALR